MIETQLSLAEVVKAAGNIPNGKRLSEAMRAYLRRQANEIEAWLRQLFRNGRVPGRAPDLSHWTNPMVETTAPLLQAPVLNGARQMSRRIAAAFPGEGLSPQALFRLIHPHVEQYTETQAFDFCDETNATSRMRVDRALVRLRAELDEGLEAGELYGRLGQRVARIFRDPLRAYTIGRTEGARAMNGGALLMATKSGVVSKKRWNAKSDACENCRALSGRIVGIDEDFAYDAEAKPAYRRIPHPPRHPH